jgi:hypothetical protein
MKLGARFPRGLAVAAVAAVTVVPLAASAAAAAPAAPTAYSVFGSAAPLVWADSSSVPVGDLHVPFVVGRTNNLALASSYSALAVPDRTSKAMSGEQISGLQCAGYDPKTQPCKDPFQMVATGEHAAVPDAGHSEQSASFTGKDGKFPGGIRALTDCPGNCGPQVVRSTGTATGPAGALPTYVSVGSSSATHDLTIDDKGRLVSTATSELDNVSIGPKNEVHFSKLVTTAQALGAGPENSKDGRTDLRINDFYILDTQVELTRAGLRLANAGPSEQEAYDGAKVLLKKLKDRGITLTLPNFDAQLVKTPDHVTVDVSGLGVLFEQSVGSVNATVSSPLQLGHSTAVVAALDASGKNVEIQQDKNGNPVVVTTAPSPAPTPNSGQAVKPGGPGSLTGGGRGQNTSAGGKPSTTGTPGSVPPPATTGTGVNGAPTTSNGQSPSVTTPAEPAPSGQVGTGDQGLNDPTQTALPSIKDVERKLGLRGAHSVSRAFGAFFGLGLILPLARFLIRRLG